MQRCDDENLAHECEESVVVLCHVLDNVIQQLAVHAESLAEKISHLQTRETGCEERWQQMMMISAG
jgi:hypothetical protein